MKRSGIHTISALLGWYGFIAVLSAYVFVQFGQLSVHAAMYQFLNLTGSLGIFIFALRKKDQPAAWLNFFWALVALVAWVSGK